MLNPVYHVTLATCIMVIPAFIAGIFPSDNSKAMLLISLPILIFGIVYLFYSFWQYLIGMAAVSYLAKDVLENKEIKSSNDYISYVKENGKSYAKYWLWTCLFWIIIVAVLFLAIILIIQKGPSLQLSKSLIIFSSIAGAILLWPLSIGLGISYLFWAYDNKQDDLGHDKSLACILKSVRLCYTDPLRCVGYFLLLGLSVFVITLPIFIFLSLFTYFVIVPGVNHFITDVKTARALVSLIANILQNFVYYIMTYFTSFAATKFYFNFIKNDNNEIRG